jgi:hypothetical protein
MTTKAGSVPVVTPVALTRDVTEMVDYVRSEPGRAAIDRGLRDINESRVLTGKGSLAKELDRRAMDRNSRH